MEGVNHEQLPCPCLSGDGVNQEGIYFKREDKVSSSKILQALKDNHQGWKEEEDVWCIPACISEMSFWASIIVWLWSLILSHTASVLFRLTCKPFLCRVAVTSHRICQSRCRIGTPPAPGRYPSPPASLCPPHSSWLVWSSLAQCFIHLFFLQSHILVPVTRQSFWCSCAAIHLMKAAQHKQWISNIRREQILNYTIITKNKKIWKA